MHRAWPALLTLLWLALPPLDAGAVEPLPLPALSARVTDLTATLDATQRGRLEAQVAAIDRAGRAQIAVLLVPTTQPETIEQFGIRLAEAWKIGRKGVDNGIIIIVAKNDRKMRIEVGYGLEGSIPDAVAKRIIAERMAPLFKQGDFFGGLQAALQAIDEPLGGKGVRPAMTAESAAAPHSLGEDVSYLVSVLVMSLFLRSMFGLFGSLLAAALAGWLAWLALASWLAAVLAALLAFVLSFASLPTRSAYSSSGGGDGDYSGGSSDFSGGGGGFGGGGASGDW